MTKAIDAHWCRCCEKFMPSPLVDGIYMRDGICARRVQHDNLLIIKSAAKPVPSDELAEIARHWVTGHFDSCPYYKHREEDHEHA